MKKIMQLLQTEGANVKLEVSGEDLLAFSNDLINRAVAELSTHAAQSKEEKFYSKSEVLELCGVCDTTLWHWNKRGYLKCVKVGSKVRYRKSDVEKILGVENSKSA
ncbi:MAG: helix-turn-helix domain-containing protein [Rikenellaceae bacterium]